MDFMSYPVQFISVSDECQFANLKKTKSYWQSIIGLLGLVSAHTVLWKWKYIQRTWIEYRNTPNGERYVQKHTCTHGHTDTRTPFSPILCRFNTPHSWNGNVIALFWWFFSNYDEVHRGQNSSIANCIFSGFFSCSPIQNWLKCCERWKIKHSPSTFTTNTKSNTSSSSSPIVHSMYCVFRAYYQANCMFLLHSAKWTKYFCSKNKRKKCQKKWKSQLRLVSNALVRFPPQHANNNTKHHRQR